MRVLIIDDHAIVRRGIISLLKDAFEDVEVGEAADTRQGMEAVRGGPWDLALVDINLPGRGGLDLIEEIKRDCPSLPVLVVSSHSEQDYAVRALKCGAAGFVSKQAAADVLVTAIQRVLAGRPYVSLAVAERLAGVASGEAGGVSHDVLSNRELQVLQLVANGRTVKEIAAELSLSEKTVATYRARISEKMNLASNVELTRYAIQNGLVG